MTRSAKAAQPNRRRTGQQVHKPDRKRSPRRKSQGGVRVRDIRSRRAPVAPASPPAEPERQSKQAAVIALLKRPDGVTVAEIMAATGWQPHTVRGLFSGTLKKKLGLTLGSAQEDRGRVYRIVDAGETGERASPGR